MNNIYHYVTNIKIDKGRYQDVRTIHKKLWYWYFVTMMLPKLTLKGIELNYLFSVLSFLFKLYRPALLSVCAPREGVIIECPIEGQYHDRRDLIIMSQMAVSNNFITVTVI